MNNPSDTPSSLDADHQASTPTTDAEAPVKPVRRRRAPKAEAVADSSAEPLAQPAATEAAGESAVAEASVTAEASTVKRRRRAVASDEAVVQAELPLQDGDSVPAAKPARSRAPKADAVFKAPQAAESAPGPEGSPGDVAAAPVSPVLPTFTLAPEPQVDLPATPAAAIDASVASGQAEAAPAGQSEDGESSSESPEQQQREGGRRRNRRDRKRGPRPDGVDGGAAPSSNVAAFDDAQDSDDDNEPAAPRPVPADVNEVFAQVLAGDFDGEDAAPSPDEAPQKRVLLPEPDAPKLHKVLAQAGVGSRRDMEQLIADGHITVNGEPAHTGQRISFGDQVKVNGKPIRFRIQPPAPRIIAYHKPAGEVVTNDDPQQRPTVFRRLPRLPQGKWQSVGRLDINTEGLLLFTNSGELANQLMHPRFGVEREYAVRVLGSLDQDQREELLDGVHVDGQEASFRSIEDGGGEGANRWYRVVITEGRNREVRKLFDAVGLTVSRLIRIRYGTVVLPRGLKRGVWVDLDDTDVRTIRRLTGTDGPRRDGNVGGKPNQPGRNNDRQGGQGQGQGQGQQGKRGRDRNRGDRPNGPGGPYGQGGGAPNNAPVQQHAAPRGDFDPDADHEEDFGPIPNPLEQTFDRRFAGKSRPFATGFGNPNPHHNRGGNAPNRNGPREPDPMQTSVGYIGADAFHRKGNRGGSGGGGGGGGRPGGGGGGNRGGGGGNRGGGGFGGNGGGRRGR